MIREASLYERLGDGKVKCHVCAHTCTISPDKIAICRTRQNREGKLYT
ncbi:MAG TPA: AmmeMemoRadiSam system radical SAM enzyme, partial [Candidatus Methanoperedenaceae archaeon]|nr:AmmeMemoRadiSam system radical SAM enzyme [Candidatus Methanoperedenaceae archaeon]